jgi:hypothetical protein
MSGMAVSVCCTPSAMGSMICCHAGQVFSSHSLRLHTPGVAVPAGKVVAGSSHTCARSNASPIRRTSLSLTDGSPFWLIAWRARFLARSQSTGSGGGVLAALQHRAELLQHGAELRHVEAAGVVGIIGVGGEPERKIAAHHIRLFRRGLLGYDDRP